MNDVLAIVLWIRVALGGGFHREYFVALRHWMVHARWIWIACMHFRIFWKRDLPRPTLWSCFLSLRYDGRGRGEHLVHLYVWLSY
jgi:hypothetical protein